MAKAQHDKWFGGVNEIASLPIVHSEACPPSCEYATLMNRFKLLNLVQRVAHRDVMEMIATIGLETLASRCTMQRWMKAGELDADEPNAQHASPASASKPTPHSAKASDATYPPYSHMLQRAQAPHDSPAVVSNSEHNHMSQIPSVSVHKPPHPMLSQSKTTDEAGRRTRNVPRYRTRQQREWFFNQLAQPRHRLRVVDDSEDQDENRCPSHTDTHPQRMPHHRARTHELQENSRGYSSRERPSTKIESVSHPRHDGKGAITDGRHHCDPRHAHRARYRRRERHPTHHDHDHNHDHDHDHRRRHSHHRYHDGDDNYNAHQRDGRSYSRSRGISVEEDDDEHGARVHRRRDGRRQEGRQRRRSQSEDSHTMNRKSFMGNRTQDTTQDSRFDVNSDTHDRVATSVNMNNTHDVGTDGGNHHSTDYIAHRNTDNITSGNSENDKEEAAAHRTQRTSHVEQSSVSGRASYSHAHETVFAVNVPDTASAQETQKDVSHDYSMAPDKVDAVVQTPESSADGRVAPRSLSLSQMKNSLSSATTTGGGGGSVPYHLQSQSQFSTFRMSSGGGSPGRCPQSGNDMNSATHTSDTAHHRSDHTSHHDGSPYTTSGGALRSTTTSAIHGLTPGGSLGDSGVARAAAPASRGAFAPKAKPKGAVDSPRVPMQAIQHAAALISRQRLEQQQQQQQQSLPDSRPNQPASPFVRVDPIGSVKHSDDHVVRHESVLPSSHTPSANTTSLSNAAGLVMDEAAGSLESKAEATKENTNTSQSSSSLPVPPAPHSFSQTASHLTDADQSTLRALSHTIDGLLSSHRRILGSVIRNTPLDDSDDSAGKVKGQTDTARKWGNKVSAERERAICYGGGRDTQTMATSPGSGQGDAFVDQLNHNRSVVTVDMNSSSSTGDESEVEYELRHYDAEETDENGDDELLLAQIRRRVTTMHAETARISRGGEKTLDTCDGHMDSDGLGGDDAAAQPRLMHAARTVKDKAMPQSREEGERSTRESGHNRSAGGLRRLRGSLQAAVCNRLRSYQLASFENMAFHEKQWNNSTTSQFVFAQRLTNTLFDDCLDDVMAEVESIMDTYVDGLAEYELQ